MSSFFKASCLIFWLTWLLCFSFILGTRRYINNHVVVDKRMSDALNTLDIVCATNVAFAFIGCIFLKCDIHHTCCAGLYMICIALISPAMSIWGITQTSKSTDANTPDQTQMETILKAHFQNNGEIPRWLSVTEVELKCCGILGPTDYRNLYREILPISECKEKKCDVPPRCCNGTESKPCPKCIKDRTDNKDDKWIEQIVTTKSYTNADTFTIDQKCDNTTKEKFEYDKVKFSQIEPKGCYSKLKNLYQDMILCLYVFFIILLVCSLLMLFAYGRSFCKSSHITGEKSDYSLDVETVSVLDLPALGSHTPGHDL